MGLGSAAGVYQVKGQQEALNPRIEELHDKIGGLQARSDAEKAALSAQLHLRANRVALLETVQADFFRARLGLRFDRSVPHGACVCVCAFPTVDLACASARLSSSVAAVTPLISQCGQTTAYSRAPVETLVVHKLLKSPRDSTQRAVSGEGSE